MATKSMLKNVDIKEKYLGRNLVEALEDMIEIYGEDGTKSILANFSCPKNKLDRDEIDIDGEYLLQWICYMGRK